jgi:hypothetical protein
MLLIHYAGWLSVFRSVAVLKGACGASWPRPTEGRRP